MKKIITLLALVSPLFINAFEPGTHAGEYQNLYAPWRNHYNKEMVIAPKTDIGIPQCPFCAQIKEPADEKNFFIRRFKHCVVVLNIFPYNAGHLMILPLEHKADLGDLNKEARTETMQLIIESTRILREELHAKGINIGINVGLIAGASIPDHLHIHLIPRWPRDTNFLRIMSNTHVIPCDMHALYKTLKKSFGQLNFDIMS